MIRKLIFAFFFLVLSVSTAVHAVDVATMGVASQLDTGYLPGRPAGEYVRGFLVEVKKGWLSNEQFSLYISILGFNGGEHFHGQQMVQLSATELFLLEKDVALVIVRWTSDRIARIHEETYEVSVQVVFPNGEFGEPKVSSFAP